MAAQFTWTADEIRDFGYQVVDLIAEHLTGLPERAVFQPVPRAVIDTFLQEQAPVFGSAPEAVLAEFAERIEPYPFGNGHPRFFGWINSPPDVVAVFAEALAAAMNPSVAGGNHAAVYVEREVIGWFRTLFALPPESMGLLVSGSSMANLTALAVARHAAASSAGVDMRATGLQGVGPRFVVYVSQEGHSSLRKAVELLGIGSDNVRTIGVDPNTDQIRLAELEATIVQDRFYRGRSDGSRRERRHDQHRRDRPARRAGGPVCQAACLAARRWCLRCTGHPDRALPQSSCPVGTRR